MTTEQAGLVATGALALVALLLAALALRTARRAAARTEELVADLAARQAERDAVAAPAVPVEETPADASPYVITGLDTAPGAAPETRPVPARIDGRLFTDIVARETTVRAASWAHGVRRALSPESRNRIAFQVRQQAKQSRRDRRAEVREALREYRARHRADTGDAA